MATGTTMTNLLTSLDISNDAILYNSEIETTIKNHGGTVAYSYNNIIMASEITDELYNELKKNPYIDYIESLPLKKYGEIDYNLIDKIDTTKIFLGEISMTTITGNTTSSIDGISGQSRPKVDGISPSITNSILTLSALTNESFHYNINATGTTPITFDFIKPLNYNGKLEIINANILNGTSYDSGMYDILLIASNDSGVDSITLNLSIIELTKILNTNLIVYSKIGSQFSYTIESSGALPKLYSATGLPSGLILVDNTISGSISSEGNYNVIITVSGATSSDYKTLTIKSGVIPIITSVGQITKEQNLNFEYIITSNPTGLTYSVIGSLPPGLVFKTNKISGIPNSVGEYFVKIKAINPFGEAIKDLKIVIFSMGT